MTLADVRPGLRALLLANANIAAIVGTRVYPVILPQGIKLDSIVYTRILESEPYHYVGPSGLIIARFQIDAWSESADRATVLGNLIKEHIGGFSGQVSYGSASPADYVIVEGVFLVSGGDDYDSESFMHRRRADYNIVYKDRNA
jgi:hypothetical protein